MSLMFQGIIACNAIRNVIVLKIVNELSCLWTTQVWLKKKALFMFDYLAKDSNSKPILGSTIEQVNLNVFVNSS